MTAKPMKKVRVIPRLDVKGENVVKGVHLEGLRVLGQPGEFASAYYQAGADEIIYMDSVASLYGRNNLHSIVQKAAEHIFIPLTVGGGIRTLHDVQSLLKIGADKVAINTALFSNPTIISEVAERFGSQCMVVSIDVVKNEQNRYECLADNGRENTGVDLLDWVEKVVDLGAGEILLTSVDREGTGKGYDIDLVRMVAREVPIPVIACGGAGQADHVVDVVGDGSADAVCAASLFHYDLIANASNLSQSNEGNKDFISRAKLGDSSVLRKGIVPIGIDALKNHMSSNGIGIRKLRHSE